MSPNIVLARSAMATAVPVPLTTEVPRNTQVRRVRVAWHSCGVVADRLVGRQRLAGQHRLLDRQIAATRAAVRRPAPVAGREPEHVARHDVPAAASRCQVPSRSTVAVGVTDARSRSAACCERYDCQKLIATPSTTIVTMIRASTRCPSVRRSRWRRAE